MQPHYSQPSRNNPMSLKINEAKYYYSAGIDFKICLQTRKFTGPTEKPTPEWLFRYPAFLWIF